MIDLVERLAERRCSPGYEGNTPDEEARWWLRAIADELDKELYSQAYYGVSPTNTPMTFCGDVVKWLRS